MAQKKKRISRRTVARATVITVVFAALAVLCICRLAYLQIHEYDYYRKKVADEITVETKVNPERGTIYDRNGNILATNSTVYLCFISPQDIIDAMAEKDKDSDDTQVYTWSSSDGKSYDGVKMDELISRFLADTLDIDYSSILEKTAKKGRRYEVIANEISVEKAEMIQQFISDYKLTSQIYLRPGAIRYYPYGDLASHVIGFTNSDGIGIYGLEAYYNNLLEGSGGRYVSAQDALNNDMDFEYETYIEAEDGQNLYTTIDTYIQYELENQLEATVAENKVANRATGIVMNVNTGDIYAMATSPSFDCNDPYTLDDLSQAKYDAYQDSEDFTADIQKLGKKKLKEEQPELSEEDGGYGAALDGVINANREELSKQAVSDYYFNLVYEMWKNKAITELYEPGSTSKIITTAMVFEEGVTNPEESFTCTGSMKVEGYGLPIKCHKAGGHGTMPYRRMLQQSCNPTLMTVALRLGREKFYNYFLDFGYGEITGIDLPNEASTYYHSFKDFSNVSLAVYAFGQTYKTTPLQQLCAISSVANGGKLLTPHLLKSVTDSDSNTVDTYETKVKRQVVSTEVCKTIAGILEQGVATDGGAKNAYVKGYKVAAKTGTSEKIDTKDSTGQTYLRVGSCVAFAPADDPEIAVIIIADEPMGGSVYGSIVAAPYVSNFLANILPYLGYEPNYTEEELANVEASILDYTGYDVDTAKIDITNRGLVCEVVGNGDTITSQVPAAGSTVSKNGGRVIVYTGAQEPQKTVEVPDVVGKSAEAANRILTNAGLNISLSGATNNKESTVATQSLAAGTTVAEGTVVEISLRNMTNVADD